MIDLVTLGASIRTLRERAKITQRELAERAGVSHQMVSFIEQGAKNVTVGTLAAVIEGLGYAVRVEIDIFQDADDGEQPSDIRFVRSIRPADRNEVLLQKWSKLTMHEKVAFDAILAAVIRDR